MTNCAKCEHPTTGKSKYCREHSAIARREWVAAIASRKVEQESLQAHYAECFRTAHRTADQSARALVPRPMHIRGYEPIADGVCGFAWVTIRPGNSSFAHWAKKHAGASKAYGTGLQIWIGDYDQSMERKQEYARVLARTLTEQGIPGISYSSRMD